MAYQYMENLPCSVLERYRAKLDLVGLKSCPYKLPCDDWSNDPKDWPRVEYPDMYHYLTKTPGVFTHGAMENYRSLEAHRLFTSGWVQTILHKRTSGIFIFRADVRPSWRVTEEPHHPWVAVSPDGVVVTAHCDCKAGLGESCSHIAAILFKLEAAVWMGYSSTACTDELCTWNACFVSNVSGAPISNIDFYTKEGEAKCGRSRSKSEPTPATEADQQRLLNALASADTMSVGLSAFAGFASPFVPRKQVPMQGKLPQSLRWLFDVKHKKLTSNEMAEKCQVFQLTVTDQHISCVEETTRAQALSLVWHEQRAGMITASIAHQALHTNESNPALSLIKRVCSSKPCTINTSAVQWGREHENEVLNMYTNTIKQTHTQAQISKPGFIICKSHPFLGATPDGYVSCECCGKGTVEIKCPYKFKDTTIRAATEDNSFCLDESMKLKRTHAYFTQVQVRMFVSELQYADFILWTTHSYHMQRIEYDEQFVAAILPKLELVWRRGILPELLSRNLEQDRFNIEPPTCQPHHNEVLYCICRSSKTDGDMVACDHCDEWFHLECLKLRRLPVTKSWYCASCKKQKTED